jgi:hypothetical protein
MHGSLDIIFAGLPSECKAGHCEEYHENNIMDMIVLDEAGSIIHNTIVSFSRIILGLYLLILNLSLCIRCICHHFSTYYKCYDT